VPSFFHPRIVCPLGLWGPAPPPWPGFEGLFEKSKSGQRFRRPLHQARGPMAPPLGGVFSWGCFFFFPPTKEDQCPAGRRFGPGPPPLLKWQVAGRAALPPASGERFHNRQGCGFIGTNSRRRMRGRVGDPTNP